MRYPPADPPYGSYGDPGPEEVALQGWLEDSGPYMTLGEPSGPGLDDEPDED
jgi:hypothetical protein